MIRRFSSLLTLSAALCLPAQVVVIPVDGEVEPGLHAFLKRAVAEAESLRPEAIVFEINTFGGRVDAALDIVELISSVKIRTAAYIKEKAISAGALIALSCNEIIMRENTTMGDCAPITINSEGPQMMGEKFQSPLRAKFRALAKKNGYPEKLSESMVSTDREIVEVVIGGEKKILTGVEYQDLNEAEKKKITQKRTLVAKGELLTMSADEALSLGFSKGTVKNLEEAVESLKTASREIRRLDKRRSERLLILFNKIAPILILIGLAGIYLEIKTPGFGLYGIVGVTAFLLFFTVKYIVGLADHVELLIFLAGVGLLFVEVFVLPGFGVAGVAGIGLILASVLLSMQNFVLPKMPWEVTLFKKNLTTVGVLLLLSLPLFLLGLFAASRLAFAHGLGHRGAEKREDGFAPSRDYASLVGRRGLAVTGLRPAGIAEIEGERLDVVSDGDFLEPGTAVEVTEAAGNRIVVKRAV